MTKRKIILTAFLVLLASPMLVRADTNISSCSVLNSAGETYYLTQNVTIDGDHCFLIEADNITFDCQGYTLDGNSTVNTSGVYGDDLVNITVKNCVIKEFEDGVYLDNVSTSLMYNNTVHNMIRTGLRCQNCVDWWIEKNIIHDVLYGTWTCCPPVWNSTIIDNHIYDNLFGLGFATGNGNITARNNLLERNTYGLALLGGAYEEWEWVTDSLIENNTILESYRGIFMEYTNSSTIVNNTISSNVEDDRAITVQNSFGNLIYNNLFNSSTSAQVECDYGVCANDWNITQQAGTRIYSDGTDIGGNYYDSNVTGYSESCADTNYDGFCDTPYTVAGYNISSNVDYLTYSDEYVAPLPTTTTLGAVGEALTDIGSGVGGLLDQMGGPVVVIMILFSLVGGVGILFKGIFTRFSD